MPVENVQFVRYMLAALAALVALQALGMAVVFFLVDYRLNRLLKKSDRLLKKLDRIATQSREGLARLVVWSEQLPELERRVKNLSDMVTAKAVSADESTAKALAGLRNGIQVGRSKADSALAKYAEITYQIHQAVIQPARTLSAAISGMQAGVSRLLGRDSSETDPSDPPASFPDQQIFI